MTGDDNNSSLALDIFNVSNGDNLNLTGVNSVTTKQLNDLFNVDVDQFFKYAATKKKRYETKLSKFDAENCDRTQLSFKKEEVLVITDTLATFRRFIDVAAGLSEDTINEKLLELDTEFDALHGLYFIKLQQFNQKIDAQQHPEDSTKEEDVSSKDTEEQKEGNNNHDDERESLVDKVVSPIDNILFEAETPNFLKKKSSITSNVELLSTIFESNQVQDGNLEANNQQASTPVKSQSQVRFSDVVSHHTLSDCHSTENNENSWKFVEPLTNHIEEISLVEDLQEISVIVSKKVSDDTSDVELLSLEKRHCKELKTLKLNLEKKSSNLPVICNSALKVESIKAFRCATEWIRSVEAMIYKRGLHLESDHKHVRALELPPFKGHSDGSTNVYEFLFNFNIVSRGFTETDKASYLFHNYLSEEVQGECRHVRTNFSAMKQILLNKHGNVNTLMLHKRNQIKKLKPISIRSSKDDKIKFVKSFCEILDQLLSLAELNLKDFPSMSSEIFSYSNIMSISKLLPDFIFRLFSSKYIKECSRREVQALSGEQSFDILMDVLKQYLREVEFTAELFLDEAEERSEKENKSKSKVKSIFNLTDDEISPDSKQNQVKENKERVFNTEKYYGAPCIAHKDIYTKVRQCLSGNCSLFLNMTPKQREEKAEHKKVCKLCLLHVCYKRQKSDSCLFQKIIPNGVFCKSCWDIGEIKSVLMCSDHSNSIKDCESALVEFLPGYRKGTKITLLFVGKIEQIKEPVSVNPVRVNENAFDIQTGKTVPKSDILFKTREDSGVMAIYPTQTLNLNGVNVQVLWDTGALGELVKKDIAEELKLTILDERSQSFTVAGGQVVHTKCPLYQMTIGPDDRSEFHTFPLIGVNKISGDLAEVELEPIVERVKKKLVSFPEAKEKFPVKVGGKDIDLIIGSRQSHIFPTRIYCLDDGLQIWRSPLKDCYGSNLIFSGPIEQINNGINLVESLPTFYQQYYKTPLLADSLTPIEFLSTDFDGEMTSDDHETEYSDCGTPIMNFISNVCFQSVDIMKKKPCPRNLQKDLDDHESAGCTVDYRCDSCVICQGCKQSDRLRRVSIKELAEEALIQKSVVVDVDKKISICSYPFTQSPEAYLTKLWGGKRDNFDMAKAVLKTQRNKPAEIRKSVVKFNQELYEKGFVAPVSELPVEIQNKILNSDFQHVFCWRSVHKPDSLSTPSRLVTDPTMSGFNDIIAKGTNCLTSLFQNIINWRSNKFAFCSDIAKMFNSVHLTEDMYRFSLYLFSSSLDPSEDIDLWVNLRLMYGVKSASNQATCALQKTADIKKEKLPLAHKVVTKYTYMDDSSDSTSTKPLLDKTINELTELLPFGGFKLKCVAKSGEDPPEGTSADGVSTSFAGYSWKCKEDKMKLKAQEINFSVKRRGLKKPNIKPVVTEADVEDLVKDIVLTRRNLMGKILECFDVIGIFEPIKVKLKIDLHKLTGVDYDDPVVGNVRDQWIDNLKLMHGFRQLECPRSVVHQDAIDADDLELICCSDAATTMAGVGIYVRSRLPDGSFSVKLLTARSKTSWGSIPRNELVSCLLMAETAFTVCKVLADRVKRIIFITDSVIALCWISNESLRLKQFCFARVRQIHRLVGKENFFLIAGEKNPADLLTRGHATLDDVSEGSVWQDGESWMYEEFENMPIRSYADVCADLTPEVSSDLEKEVHPTIPAIYQAIVVDDDDIFDDCMCINELDLAGDDMSVHVGKEVPQHSDVPAILLVSPSIAVQKAEAEAPTDNIAVNSLKQLSNSDDYNRYPVDFVKFGFKKAFLILSFVMKFISKLKHRWHKQKEVAADCDICSVENMIGGRDFGKMSSKFQGVSCKVYCSPLDFFLAWRLICKISTIEVKEHFKNQPSKLDKYQEKDGILYSAGRLALPDIRVETDPMMHDLNFNQPVFLNSSVITYSLIMYIHWEEESYAHAGVERTMNFLLKLVHVQNVRKIVKFIRESCTRCRYLLKRHFLPLSCNQAAFSLLRAPPFFSTMCDIAGNYRAYDSIKKRVTKPAYFLIMVCMTTGLTMIGVLEDLSTKSIILAIGRTASRVGWPKYLLLDNQTSFKTLQDAEVCFTDLSDKLWERQKLIIDFSTPHAHAEHGRAEAKVKIMKEFLEKSGSLCQRHTYIEWESIALNISSIINGLPICTNSDDTANTVGELNLITPNLFLLGRNNARAPERFVTFETNPGKALKELANTNQQLLNLLGNYIHRFIPGKKYSDVHPPEVGDVVLLLLKEAERSRNKVYKYGRVIKLNVDGRINKVLVEYRNADEVVMRQVERNIKDLVLILGCEEIGFNTLEHYLASWVQQKHL